MGKAGALVKSKRHPQPAQRMLAVISTFELMLTRRDLFSSRALSRGCFWKTRLITQTYVATSESSPAESRVYREKTDFSGEE